MTRSARSFAVALSLSLSLSIPALVVLGTVPARAQGASFIRSDFNDDGVLDIADPVSVLAFLFVGGEEPGCLDAGDANDDGRVDITDALYSLGHLFLGGLAPMAPFPGCGDDPTEDPLGCGTRAACAVPNLREAAGHCGGVPDSRYPNSLPRGDDLHRLTLTDTVAVCNDGSPAICYVRPASPGSPAADRWVLYLQGGGGCSSFEECLDRWCGRQSPAYDESKMSSRYAPESIGGTGIFRRGPVEGVDGADGSDDFENHFGDFNQVFLYYCSSDSWSGRKSDAVLTDPEDPSRKYSLHFRGHDMVRAVVDRLMEGGAESDDREVVMPALRDAELALLTGFSGGSGGVVHNGDWFASRLERNGTVVRLVRDLGIVPRLDAHSDPSEADRLAAEFEERYRDSMEQRYAPDVQDSFFDESARAALAGNDDEWRIADKTHVMFHHITTPMFVRTDLLDRNMRQTFEDMGVPASEFARMLERTLRGVPRIVDTGEEGDEIAQAGGSFATHCGDHVGLTSNTVFFQRVVSDGGGTPRSYHDTLSRWLQGSIVAVVDDPTAPSTVCGGPLPELE